MPDSLMECRDCEGRGWIYGHENECYEGDGCVCSGVQIECSCQRDPEPARDNELMF